jgi:AcrR family transcriptional regulator
VATVYRKPGCPTCARLRAAALSIVGADGIGAVSLERLSREAAVSPEELREHYPTAASCLCETYEEVSRSVLEDFAEAFRAVPSWRGALRLAGRRLLRRMAARPAEARLCFVEVLRGDHELLCRRVAARRRMVELFARELRRRRGEDEQDVHEMQLELLIGAGFQAIAAAVAAGRVEELPELEPELTERAYVFEPAGV